MNGIARKLVPLLLVAAVIFSGWRYAGWAGVALAVTGIVMYVLIHVSRLIRVLRGAADRPKGYVASSVMLNAKLKRGVNLLKVIGLTGSIGEPLTPEGQQPEVFRWTDESGSSVTCEFMDGRLTGWRLERPEAEPPAP
jgi:hypothetical protein